MWDLFRGGEGGTWELRLGMALGLLPWHFDGAKLCPALLHSTLLLPPPASLGFFSYHKLCFYFIIFFSSTASETL